MGVQRLTAFVLAGSIMGCGVTDAPPRAATGTPSRGLPTPGSPVAPEPTVTPAPQASDARPSPALPAATHRPLTPVPTPAAASTKDATAAPTPPKSDPLHDARSSTGQGIRRAHRAEVI